MSLNNFLISQINNAEKEIYKTEKEVNITKENEFIILSCASKDSLKEGDSTIIKENFTEYSSQMEIVAVVSGTDDRFSNILRHIQNLKEKNG